jgi:hypothetical protein
VIFHALVRLARSATKPEQLSKDGAFSLLIADVVEDISCPVLCESIFDRDTRRVRELNGFKCRGIGQELDFNEARLDWMIILRVSIVSMSATASVHACEAGGMWRHETIYRK